MTPEELEKIGRAAEAFLGFRKEPQVSHFCAVCRACQEDGVVESAIDVWKCGACGEENRSVLEKVRRP
jgi:hypothetical protein